MAKMKQVNSVMRYSHSKMTPKTAPVVPSRFFSPREVVKMRKTRKKLP